MVFAVYPQTVDLLKSLTDRCWLNAERLLKQLDFSGADIEKLQQMPFVQLEKASVEVGRMRPPASGIIHFRRSDLTRGWSPVAGNAAVPAQPFDPKAPDMSASVPLLVGNTLNEFINGINKPDAFKMTQEELETNVRNAYKDKTDKILEVYRAGFSNANNFQLSSVIGASSVRTMSLEQARRKVALQKAPVYCYRFDWQTPVLDGRPMAFHCSELSFVFDNTQRCQNMTGNGRSARTLAERMSEAWIHFARSGNPNHVGIPRWKSFDPATSGTMVFDDQCLFREHLDDDMQKVMSET